MDTCPRSNFSVKWFMDDLAYRIVAKSGIPSDRHHLGKLMHQSLNDDPSFILQIDGSTGLTESGGLVLERSIKCAIAMKKVGLKAGDVIAMMVPNHLDVCVPIYAALFLGVATAPIDINLGTDEIQNLFTITKPKVIFCQNDNVKRLAGAMLNDKLQSLIVTFDMNGQYRDFSSFMSTLDDDAKIEDFQPADFDPSDTLAFMLMTSGTSGVPKCAALTHTSFLHGSSELWVREYKFPDPSRKALILSPLQWLSAMFHYTLSPIMRYTRLQSPLTVDRQHAYDMINRFKPTQMIASPTLLLSLLNTDEVKKCDFSCFRSLIIGGSAVSKELLKIAKKAMPTTDICVQYGQTEVSGLAVQMDNHRPGSLGKILRSLQFRGYYNDPEKTKEVLTEDGWLKTGDLLYMDEHLNLYFVDRMKMLLKYKNHHVSPVELESVILQNPGVYDVAVTGIDDFECGDLPVACVVKKSGYDVTAQEIKDLVKDSLADTKQLRGGVIFMEQLPTTMTNKIDRAKLKKIVAESVRE